MFATVQSFTLFFFVSLAVIILLILFEDKLVAIEKKYDRKRARKRNAARTAQNNRTNRNNIRNAEVRRAPSSTINRRGYAA